MVSMLLRDQFRGISEAKMLECLARLGRDIDIVVKPARRRAVARRGVAGQRGVCLRAQAASFALARRFRLTPCSAASSARLRWTSGGMRTRNSPL